ncbi:permease for cytosine/purines, uracil, thiamine, allantoin-domain-containing protein [Suillus subluteus]|nr:permease for cytosine/purines, uracil, thiamine, allantoin-domain-containing protein [Suillus subluteus]
MGLINRIIQSLEVTHEPNLTLTEQFITNDDLLPVEPEKRTWRGYNYVAFWMADMFNINMWMIVSNVVVASVDMRLAGLRHYHTVPCPECTSWGHFPCDIPNCEPHEFRDVWEPVHSIWYGVQASIGGSCVLVMLRAMWPSINDLPSSGTDTRDFLCFFLFWLISLPVIWFPVHKVATFLSRHFFLAIPILMPIASIGFLIWCIVKAHGIGPIVHQPSTLHGSQLGWAMVVSSMSCIANKVTLVTNAPDFASRARTPSAALYPQLFTFPLTASFAIYGTAIWSPIELLGNFLNDNPSKATRFGVWFISASFVIAQMSRINILKIRLQNIRRGGYIAATVGLAMCPWNLLKNSNEFTSYLSAYSVFMSSIAGVMVTEYYVIRKGHYNVKDLYNTEKGSWYWYTYGINFRTLTRSTKSRAYAAYIAGILINAVGFAGATGRVVPLAATRIYDLSFFTGFAVSALVYWALNRVFPVIGAADTFKEIDVSGYECEAGGSRGVEETDIDMKDMGSEAASEK